MEKLVFRKALWKQNMLESGSSEQSLEQIIWKSSTLGFLVTNL